MYKRNLLLAFQIIFYGLIAWFVVQRFDELTASISLDKLLDRPIHLVISIICFLLFYILLALHWKLICDKYEKYPQQYQWLSFFASQPYKYLPSSMFTFSSRAIYAKRLGLPMKQSSVSQLVENFNILFAGACVAILFLTFQVSIVLGFIAGVIFLCGLVAVSFVPAFKIPKTALNISGRDWVSLFMLPIAGWIVAGTAFFLMVLASGQQISFTSAVAANTIAVGLGILAIFAPGGIGVREFVYIRFTIGSVGIIMWRLMTLIIDVVVGFIAIYWIKRLLKNTDPST